MFDLTRKKWRLRTLLRQRDKLSLFFDKKIQHARKINVGREEVEGLIVEMFMELDLADDEINKLRSSILMRQAQKFLLPTPSVETARETSKIDYRKFLSEESQRALIVSIRAETKERAELFGLRVAGLTGVIGALTGLVAVLLSHKW